MTASDQAQFRRCSTLEELDALSRTRRLTASESRKLEKALRRSPHDRTYTRWTFANTERLRRYLVRGKKPKQIAILMSLTERAIWRRMALLRWTVRDAAGPGLTIPEFDARGYPTCAAENGSMAPRRRIVGGA